MNNINLINKLLLIHRLKLVKTCIYTHNNTQALPIGLSLKSSLFKSFFLSCKDTGVLCVLQQDHNNVCIHFRWKKCDKNIRIYSHQINFTPLIGVKLISQCFTQLAKSEKLDVTFILVLRKDGKKSEN